MKKVFTLISMAALLTLSSACTKYQVIEKTTDIKVVEVDVPQTSWAYSNLDNNNFYYATVSMPEINSDTFKKGTIQVYRVYDANTPNATQVILPCVRHRETLVGDNWYFYTETIDYEFQQGSLTICYTASDFDYEIDDTFVPEAMKFRCIIY